MLSIKLHRQKPGLCGPACLKMALEFFSAKGRPAFGGGKSEAELTRLAKGTKNKGTNAADLLGVARSLGFDGFIKDSAEIKDIKKFVVNNKIPVIVDWFSRDDGHYSVVVDVDNKNIFLADPETAKIKKIDLKTFKRVWFDFPGDFLKTKNEIIIRRMIVIWPTNFLSP
ncbi:hypothetical protein EPN28_02125 [Patescibacteria group bacterium]|nr:MAG: hypothetical protein EPN28_02125 [Patescibacteria group bacterium]